MSNLKTDNSFLRDKIALRLRSLPEKSEIKVIDCFHGSGVIWYNVALNTDKKIIVHGIDIKAEADFSLTGDNLKILDTLDLDSYDIIDFDAYGLPDEQIEKVARLITRPVLCFYTFIQSFNGALSNHLLKRIGISEAMYDKCRSIFNRGGHRYFLAFLSRIGVDNVSFISHGSKFYGYFYLTKTG